MSSPMIFEGRIHAPYFIFVRCGHDLIADQILQKFGLSSYQRNKEVPLFQRYAILADADGWLLLADDWFYTLWHRSSTGTAISELAREYDLFACSVGDCDESFDFLYYESAQLIRKYVCIDPDFRGGSVLEDFGEPMAGEAKAFHHPQALEQPRAIQGKDKLSLVMEIASSLGIRTHFREDEIQIYAPSDWLPLRRLWRSLLG